MNAEIISLLIYGIGVLVSVFPWTVYVIREGETKEWSGFLGLSAACVWPILLFFYVGWLIFRAIGSIASHWA
jgi:hypothetical protein